MKVVKIFTNISQISIRNLNKAKMMKPITTEEILKSNRFVKWRKEKVANPNADVKFTIRGKRIIPSREEAKKMNLRTLGLFVAVDTLRHRSASDAIKNAEHWMARGKKDIIETFFPAPRKPDLNDLF